MNKKIIEYKIEILELKLKILELKNQNNNINSELDVWQFSNPKSSADNLAETNRHYSVYEASELLKISKRTVHRRCKKDNIRKKDNKYLITGKIINNWNSLTSNNTDNDFEQKKTKTYLMKDCNTNLYKIGRSNDPKSRERTLQSEKPSIKMVKIWNYNIEKKLHKLYSKFRIRGEYFELNKIQVRYICTHF